MTTLAGTHVGYSHYPFYSPLQPLYSYAQPGNNWLTSLHPEIQSLDTKTLVLDAGAQAISSHSPHIFFALMQSTCRTLCLQHTPPHSF